MQRLNAVCAAVIFLIAHQAAEAAELMGANDLRKTFSGKTIYLSAPFGALPIRYSAGGTMVAQSRAMGAYAGVSRDQGSWWVAGNQVCQRWKIWMSGKTQCFTVRRSGTAMYWTSNDGMSGTARAGN